MTKVILHGGYPTHPNKQNDIFYQEMVKDIPSDEVNVLVVYFAKEESDYEEKFKKEKQRFIKNARNKKLNLKLATKENFIEEIKEADVIYLAGGKSLKLLNTLKGYPKFKNVIKNKTIAGESAGSNVLSKYFYSRTEGGVFEGLGVVQVRECPHYNPSKSPAVEELNKYPNNLEMILLGDYEHKVLVY